MDILPSKKLEINLILNAYDEDVIEKLNDSSDATLRALQLIKTLSDDYGLTTESSKWAVISWCYILGYDDIATALDIISVGGNLQRVTPAPGKTHIIGIGTYKAGFDFQSGDIKLKHLTKDLQAPGYIPCQTS